MKQTKEHFVGISYDELLAENAKLREERDEWHRVAVSKQDIIDHMRDARAENAKLRELIQKVWKWESNGCYECPLEKDCKVLCVYDGDCGMAVEIEKELQELGIEVSE